MGHVGRVWGSSCWAWRAALLLCLSLGVAGQARAAGGGHWADGALHLGLAYPAGWAVVAERGAALKLRAADGKGEFEIFRLAHTTATDGATGQANAALVRLRCAGTVRTSVAAVGRLGVKGNVATGLCTGADLGWRLTVTVFTYRGNAVLLRSWLYRGQQGDRADLATIAASFASTSA